VAVVIVGGQTRGVGKTSVVCSLIAGMPEREWTAVKLSAHGHGAAVEIHEEMNAGSGADSECSDSGRYLDAGAVRSYYISVPVRGLWRAMPRFLDILAEANNAVVESTSVLAYLRPELALAVVNPLAAEVKESLHLWGERFDAVIATGASQLGGALKELSSKPRFVVQPPVFGSAELHAFVRQELKK
jgi:hypothetical protein